MTIGITTEEAPLNPGIVPVKKMILLLPGIVLYTGMTLSPPGIILRDRETGTDVKGAA
jgi:hypothetical protein